MHCLLEVNSTWIQSLERVWLVEVEWSKRRVIQNQCPVVLLTSEEWKV